MNFYLRSALNNYLENDAPGYAFLIKAPWGTGKTFFINVELPPTKTTENLKIEKTAKIEKPAKSVLHFSLNGCSDMLEFRKRMLKLGR